VPSERCPPALRRRLVVAALLALTGTRLQARLAPLSAREAPPWSEIEIERESDAENREYDVKAAFLLNFVRYTTWPKGSFDDDSSPLVLSVVGGDPFGDVLETTFRGEEVGGRRIEIRRSSEVPEVPRGHVVFCGRLEQSERLQLLERCSGRPVLLIGETPGFAEAGACLNFYLSEHKVRFEVNPDAAEAARLKLSPGILKHARIVRPKKER